MRKFIRWIGSLATSVVLLAGATAAQEKVKLQMDWSPDFTHAGVHVALSQGYFKDAGLDVELLDGQGGSNAVQLVGAGQADVGWASIGTMAFGRGNGVPLKSIAQLCSTEYAMIVPKGVKSMDELVGKKIVSTATGGAAPFLEPFLVAAGHTPDQFEVVIVDNTALLSTYATGKADAVLSGFVSALPEVESLRPSDAISFQSVGLNLPGYGLFATEETIKNKREMLAKFVPAVLKGRRYVFDGHEVEAVDMIIKSRPSDQLERQRDVWITQIKLMRQLFKDPNDKNFGAQTEEDWSKTIAVMEKAKLLKQPGSKPTDYFTNEFISN